MSPDHGRDDLDSTRSFRYIAAGAVISHYRIIEKIGEGAMGQVYLAEDTKLKRRVALKFLPYDLTRNEEARKRFLQEARAASTLDHPHICNIHEIEETPDGRTFICMSYYEGETLKKKIESGSLDVEAAVRIVIEICDGLSRAHEAGIVHRDIKPGNIIITDRGRTKVLDFGLAKLAGQTQLTRTGTTVGTVLYMSPEQAQGETVDRRSDIWSVGVVLYEALTGRRPFKGANSSAVIYSILHDKPAPVTRINRDLPKELDGIVARCLRKDPSERYQTAGELREELKRLSDEMASSSFITVSVPAFAGARTARRIALPVGLAAVALLLVLLTPIGESFHNWFGLGRGRERTTLAVLQFETDTDSPEGLAFSTGLASFAAGQVAGLEALRDSFWVVPAFYSLSSKAESPGSTGAELGASVVVTGSLVFLEDSISLSLSLFEVDAKMTATEKNHIELRDHRANLRTWQDSLPLTIAEMSGVPLARGVTEVLTRGRTTVPRAFDSYLAGIGYMVAYKEPADIDSARVTLERSTQQDPSYARAWTALGEAYWRTFRTSGGIWAQSGLEACDRALALNPDMARAYSIKGLIYRDTRFYEESADAFRRALALDSLNAYAYRTLGRLYEVKLAEPAMAESLFVEATRKRPHDARARRELARFYFGAHEYKNAAEQYEIAAMLAPADMWVYNGLSYSYSRLGEGLKAAEALERALAVRESYPTYCALGYRYFYELRYADAARAYEKAAHLAEGNDYRVWGDVAESYYWSPGNQDTARVLFLRAAARAEDLLATGPTSCEALSDLASYYASAGEEEKALEVLNRLVGLEPSEPGVWSRIGEAYEILGDRDSALYWIGRSLDQGYRPDELLHSPRFKGIRADERFLGLPGISGELGDES
jgi:serine/threonine-protein kinase